MNGPVRVRGTVRVQYCEGLPSQYTLDLVVEPIRPRRPPDPADYMDVEEGIAAMDRWVASMRADPEQP